MPRLVATKKKNTENLFDPGLFLEKSGIRPRVYLEKSFTWLREARIRSQNFFGEVRPDPPPPITPAPVVRQSDF